MSHKKWLLAFAIVVAAAWIGWSSSSSARNFVRSLMGLSNRDSSQGATGMERRKAQQAGGATLKDVTASNLANLPPTSPRVQTGVQGPTAESPSASNGVQLRNLLNEPAVSNALVAFRKECEIGVKRLKQCSGFGMGANRCYPEKAPNPATYANQEVLVACLQARQREARCSAGLDCTSFVDWWNRDSREACAKERAEVEAGCAGNDQR